MKRSVGSTYMVGKGGGLELEGVRVNARSAEVA